MSLSSKEKERRRRMLEDSKGKSGLEKYVNNEAIAKIIENSDALKKMHKESLKGGGVMSWPDALRKL